jgi:hypothetical protein
LIRICELTSAPGTWNLGGELALRETTRALKTLGEASANRGQLSKWILYELHNLSDKLSLVISLKPSSRDNFLRAVALLKDEEIRAILAGPGLPKVHKLKGTVSHSWSAVVIGQLYETGRSDTLLVSQASAVRRCANDSDLPGLVALLEQLEVEYVNNIDLGIQPVLATTVDNIRTCFIKNPLIASSRLVARES